MTCIFISRLSSIVLKKKWKLFIVLWNLIQTYLKAYLLKHKRTYFKHSQNRKGCVLTLVVSFEILMGVNYPDKKNWKYDMAMVLIFLNF